MKAGKRILADRRILPAWPYRCESDEFILLRHGRVLINMAALKAREYAELEVTV